MSHAFTTSTPTFTLETLIALNRIKTDQANLRLERPMHGSGSQKQRPDPQKSRKVEKKNA